MVWGAICLTWNTVSRSCSPQNNFCNASRNSVNLASTYTRSKEVQGLHISARKRMLSCINVVTGMVQRQKYQSVGLASTFSWFKSHRECQGNNSAKNLCQYDHLIYRFSWQLYGSWVPSLWMPKFYLFRPLTIVFSIPL